MITVNGFTIEEDFISGSDCRNSLMGNIYVCGESLSFLQLNQKFIENGEDFQDYRLKQF